MYFRTGTIVTDVCGHDGNGSQKRTYCPLLRVVEALNFEPVYLFPFSLTLTRSVSIHTSSQATIEAFYYSSMSPFCAGTQISRHSAYSGACERKLY